MKRGSDEISDEQPTKRSRDEEEPLPTHFIQLEESRESDVQVLKQLKEKCAKSSENLDVELEDAKHKYFVSYFKKVLEKLPFSKHILESVNIEENREGFLKSYSIAKTCVNCEVQMKKYRAFNAVFNVLNNLMGKFVHNSFVMPHFTGLIPKPALESAFAVYQTHICEEEEPNELQCIAYLIQTELEKEEPLRVPNPIYNSFTKQITAASKYITHLLTVIATNKLST